MFICNSLDKKQIPGLYLLDATLKSPSIDLIKIACLSSNPTLTSTVLSDRTLE